jgi:hypothetical protein
VRTPYILDGFIEPEACEKIIAAYRHLLACEQVEPSVPGLRECGPWKECACWALKALDREYVGQILDSLRERIIAHTRRAFGETEPIALDFTNMTALNIGAYYPLHADLEKRDERDNWVENHTPFRKYAAMVYLNTKDINYEGGQLQFPGIGLAVNPKAGRLVIFSGSREHEHQTTPVVRGTRYAIATWITTNPELFEQWV